MCNKTAPLVACLLFLVVFGQSRRLVATVGAAETGALKLGLLLPPEEPQALSVRQGALLAQEQASKTGAVEIIVRGRTGQWGADAVEVARMVTDDAAQGLIAPPDGAASHLTLQVSGRTAVPVVTLCADSSVGRTGVPWLFRIVPRTIEQANALFQNIPEKRAGQTNHCLAVVPEGRAGREVTHDLLQAARRSSIDLNTIDLSSARTNTERLGARILDSKADLVLLWLDPVSAAVITKEVRAAGFHGILAGPSGLETPDFTGPAGEAANGFIIAAIAPGAQTTEPWQNFKTAFQAQWGREPDIIAGMSYDAATLLIHLLAQPEFRIPPHKLPAGFSIQGVTGELAFDIEGNRQVQLTLLEVRGGSFVPVLKNN